MKTLYTVVSVWFVLMSFAPAHAETRGWGVGAGVFDSDFGFQFRKSLWLGGDISQLSVQAAVYFPERTTFRLDADYHFVLKSGSGRFYPLAGLDFAFNSKQSKFGINAGGGLNFMLTESLAAFVEGKYIFGDWDGWAFTGGINF